MSSSRLRAPWTLAQHPAHLCREGTGYSRGAACRHHELENQQGYQLWHKQMQCFLKGGETIVQSQLRHLNCSDPITTSQLEIMAPLRYAASNKILNLSESKFSVLLNQNGEGGQICLFYYIKVSGIQMTEHKKSITQQTTNQIDLNKQFSSSPITP